MTGMSVRCGGGLRSAGRARVTGAEAISPSCSKEVSDMTSRDIDAYLDFFEDCIEPNNILPSREPGVCPPFC